MLVVYKLGLYDIEEDACYSNVKRDWLISSSGIDLYGRYKRLDAAHQNLLVKKRVLDKLAGRSP